MNRPRNGHDYAGIVAVILAVTLCLVLLFTGFAIVVLNRDIGESAQRLLTTIGAGLVGALATYVGTASRHRGDRDRGGGGGSP